ncbi:hypothetical protein J2Z79_001766 [Symbiobacterium terraclitae]|uniref:NERD domain-containing protein n=1 Tax=Symbiobacterium terraclitae TaxID=557451 RepID=A0ABS4JS45_9FIRM|nr:hypothetical protein [Symbiobacterium terraclitae]MBP2018358.1 hypothetical protein [Symbiobacterium terraclitae]
MRGYLIGLLVIAFLVGSLFRATEVTGMRIWNMFATFGIFLFGVVGSLALSRLQQRSGLRSVQEAIKALEPDWVITDWSGQPGGRPDYLLVGPGGLLAICVEHSPRALLGSRTRVRVASAAERARLAADWVREALAVLPAAADLPVVPVLLLARMRALPEYQAEGLPVLNPEGLAEYVGSLAPAPTASRPLCYRVTRCLRAANVPATG